MTLRRRRQWELLLEQASTALTSSLEYEETLRTLTRSVVRALADYCFVDVAQNGTIVRIAKAGANPEKDELAAELSSIPIDRSRPHLSVLTLESGQVTLLTKVPHDHLKAVARDERHLSLLERLDPRSIMAIPLQARGHMLGVLVLISSHRRYEASDLRLAEELARRAAIALDNARLYRTAQGAVQARDDLLSIVAHDLRTPLGTIMLATSALAHRLEGEQRRQLEGAVRAAERMSRLINDLLDLASADAGKLGMKPGRIATSGLLHEVVELVRPLIGARELRIMVPRDLAVVVLWADRDRICQVFANIIGNAIKFTPEDGRIVVGGESRASEVCFCISDDGPGISAEDLPRVFDRFWQARKSDRRGAGLGLPISKGIVEAHGGQIWIESHPGNGTSVFFTIPSVIEDDTSSVSPMDRARPAVQLDAGARIAQQRQD